MKDNKDIPPKIYRAMLSNNYKQSHKEYQQIRNYQNRGKNPICQKEDYYMAPKHKGNILTQEYIKKMSEKPERAHIKRIPIQSNLSSGVTVITEEKQVRGIRLGPIQKNQPHSAERRKLRKKIFPDTKKNFYFDDFNSVKQNEIELNTLRNKGRYRCRPQQEHHFEFGYEDPKNITFDNIYGYQRKEENTKERIFPTEIKGYKQEKKNIKKIDKEKLRGYKNRNNVDHLSGMLESQGKGYKIQKMNSKPCNNDFKAVSDEAKKNASVRYYFENNLSSW